MPKTDQALTCPSLRPYVARQSDTDDDDGYRRRWEAKRTKERSISQSQRRLSQFAQGKEKGVDLTRERAVLYRKATTRLPLPSLPLSKGHEEGCATFCRTVKSAEDVA